MVQAVEVAHHQQQVRGLLHRKEPGKHGDLHGVDVQEEGKPASRDVDPNGTVEALHGSANRGLQLVDVQPPV